MNCLACGAWSEDDRATGYAANGLCPNCIADGWQEEGSAAWREHPPEPERLRVICAWCGAHLRGYRDAPAISHGVCPRCRESQDRDDYYPF